MTKTCKHCQVEKPVEGFYRQKNNKDGYKNLCKICDKEVRRNTWNAMRDRAKEIAGVYGMKTLCVCPRCRREHSIVMRWIGRGTPRIYCEDCRETVDLILYQGDEFAVPHSHYINAL